MKNKKRLFLYIILIIIYIFLMLSCKHEAYCWKCERYRYYHNYIGWIDSTFTVCDMTENEIIKFEEMNTVGGDSLTGHAFVCSKLKN
jgi:hypothetical protein